MRRPSYYILAALAGQPIHGYAVAKRAEALSNGSVSMAAGTLYGALDRLVAEGLIEISGEEVVSGRRRRYYQLTDKGVAALETEMIRMRSAVHAGERALRNIAAQGN